jgi:hypothetical protein
VSLSDVLALVAIVVAVGSAFGTLYLQYFQRRNVAVALGDEIYLSYGPADGSGGYSKLGMVLSVSLVNGGACDALVTLIAATIRHGPSGFQTHAWWRAFYEPTDAGVAGGSSAPVWKFKGWVRPLAATSRKVVTEWIYLRSSPLEAALPLGDFVIEFEVTETRPTGSGWGDATDEIDKRALARWVGAFTIDEAASDYLASNCVAIDGLAPDSYRVDLRRRQPVMLWSTKDPERPRLRA